MSKQLLYKEFDKLVSSEDLNKVNKKLVVQTKQLKKVVGLSKRGEKEISDAAKFFVMKVYTDYVSHRLTVNKKEVEENSIEYIRMLEQHIFSDYNISWKQIVLLLGLLFIAAVYVGLTIYLTQELGACAREDVRNEDEWTQSYGAVAAKTMVTLKRLGRNAGKSMIKPHSTGLTLMNVGAEASCELREMYAEQWEEMLITSIGPKVFDFVKDNMLSILGGGSIAAGAVGARKMMKKSSPKKTISPKKNSSPSKSQESITKYLTKLN